MSIVTINIFNIQQTNQDEQQRGLSHLASPLTHNQHHSLCYKLLVGTVAARPFWLTARHALNTHELPQNQPKIARRDRSEVILSQELNAAGQLEAQCTVSRHVVNLQQNATSVLRDCPPKPKN